MSAWTRRHVVVDETDDGQVKYEIYVQNGLIHIEWRNRENDSESIRGTELTYSFDNDHANLQMEEQYPYQHSDRQIDIPRLVQGHDQLLPLQKFLDDNNDLKQKSSYVARASPLRPTTTRPDFGGFVYEVVSPALRSEYQVRTGLNR